MSVGLIISIAASLVVILSGIFGGVIWAVKRMTETAFDRGTHSSTHEKISTDIGHAHRRLDSVENDVVDLKKSTEAHGEKHTMIIKNQDFMNSRLDKIYDILVKP